MFNFLTTPIGRLMFLDEGDGTGGSDKSGSGEGSGTATATQTSEGSDGAGDGTAQGNGVTGGQDAQTQLGSESGKGAAASQQTQQSGAASTDWEKEAKKWQGEYNKLAGGIRTDGKKVDLARTNEANANSLAAQAVSDRDAAVAKATAAELDAKRLRKSVDAGIPSHLIRLVKGDSDEAIDADIEAIRTGLLTGSSGTGDGASSTTASGSGSSDAGGKTGEGDASGSGQGNAQATGQDDGQQQTSDGQQQSGSGDGASGSGDGSGTSQAGHQAPAPAGSQGNKNWLQRYEEADGVTREKMTRDVREGRVIPDFD